MDNPLVQPDPGLFIWTIVTFLVLLALLAKFAWRPLLAALESRQQSIRKALDDVEPVFAGASPAYLALVSLTIEKTRTAMAMAPRMRPR